MPYRVASDPWGPPRRILPSDARRRDLHVSRRVALTIASVGAIMLVTLGVDLTFRPTLGPDEVPEREAFAYDFSLFSSRRFWWSWSSGCGRYAGEPRYDVNHALLSDEPTDPEVEPEGTGAARRRYVRPDPRAVTSGGVIHGTTTLVSGVAEVTERRRRRSPAL